ncbi:hypothetical protein MVI01_75110 [Myxococcus virescens]|uniref:Lipoprotein n=1 Tax=Myxococcus virescens TaxID=83456 RepID=A0A511HQ60_9BACT|nr:hypothetical protein MVI01_75110 [Myxococcus virescens]SDD41458.1 hypothetical protein SAMN04488504_101792 [Myxococcus virescens]
MRAHAVIWLSLALAVTGCSTTRFVRLDTGDGPTRVHTPFTEDDTRPPVELDDDECEEALVELARDVRPFAHSLREARQRFGGRAGRWSLSADALRVSPGPAGPARRFPTRA